MQSGSPFVHFLNLEYFFRLLYDLFAPGSASGSATVHEGYGGLLTVLSGIWLFVTVLAYLYSLAAIGVLVYATTRYFQVRAEEKPRYETISEQDEHQSVEKSRWQYIIELIESGQESDWRQAIIESDIMLDELLTRLGYQGESLGEKLRSVKPEQFATLNNAWEAHRVRNEIAHQGSQYELTEHAAHRTIANYETVFREHNEI